MEFVHTRKHAAYPPYLSMNLYLVSTSIPCFSEAYLIGFTWPIDSAECFGTMSADIGKGVLYIF